MVELMDFDSDDAATAAPGHPLSDTSSVQLRFQQLQGEFTRHRIGAAELACEQQQMYTRSVQHIADLQRQLAR